MNSEHPDLPGCEIVNLQPKERTASVFTVTFNSQADYERFQASSWFTKKNVNTKVKNQDLQSEEDWHPQIKCTLQNVATIHNIVQGLAAIRPLKLEFLAPRSQQNKNLSPRSGDRMDE